MKIKFLGASGMVTGSSYLLTNDKNESILIDCGMFQGNEETSKLNWVRPEFEPSKVAGVLLTHAHLDHCGRLPILTKMGLTAHIYMTHATRELIEITLEDTVKISSEQNKGEPLYTENDVAKLLALSKIVTYHEKFNIGSFEIEYFDAGHILGSASIVVKDNVSGKTIAFSGDLGNSPEPLVKPTEYIEAADIVLMESTYGGRVHSKENPLEILQKEINTVESFNSTLLIPSFSIERAQTLLHMIDHLKKEKKIKDTTPVYLDSPMAIKTTYTYEGYPGLFSEELFNHAKLDDPFDFPGLTMVSKAKASQKIWETNGAKIIIAGSGMMNGGRIVNHAVNYLPLPTTRLLIVGYQAEGTMGRELLNGAKQITVRRQPVPVNAKIREITSISSHADEPGLLKWISKVKGVSTIFLIHGEDDARAALKTKIENTLNLSNINLPHLNEEITI
ncbi:MAG: MBL fold metallo-hydrolase [Patescibacteria group bacterium]